MPKRQANVSETYDPVQERRILSDIQQRFIVLEKTVGPYTVLNFTETRTLDMATATATVIGNFLATMISDMQAAGRFSKP